jgi:hypothetical protein
MLSNTEGGLRLARRTFKILALMMLSLVLFQSTHTRGQSSPMATAAASLQAGSWVELTTANTVVLTQPGTDGNIVSYGADIGWDPISRRLLFVGNDHIDANASQALRFVLYDESTNAWQNLPAPPWSSPGTTDHGYYHHAVNPANGDVYRRGGKSSAIFYRYRSGVWTALPPAPIETSYACCSAIDYFPELGGLVFVQGGENGGGSVYLFSETNQQWSKLGDNFASLTGSTFTFGAYNPVYKLFVFGQNGAFYKLDTNRTITPLANPPVTFYDGIGYLGNIVADPVSGKFLVLTASTRQFYSYDVSTNTWQALASTNKPNLANISVVSTAISNYGVVAYVSCHILNCKVHLYKYAPSTQLPAPSPAVPSISLVSPSSVVSNMATTLTVNGSNFQTGFSASVSTPFGTSSLSSSALTYVSSSQVKIAVSMANVPSGQNSYTATLTLSQSSGATSGTFTVTAPTATGSLPIGALVQDGPATPEQISLLLPVTASLPQTATASVRYKLSGTTSWITGHPLFRIQPSYSETPSVGSVVDAFAWPIIDLLPGRSYDMEVTVRSGSVTDIRTASFNTRMLPVSAAGPNKTINAGSSTANIQAVFDGLNPGDVVQFQTGTYNVDNLVLRRSGTPNSPIIIRGASRTGVVLSDPGGSILQIQSSSHVVLENMTLQGSGVDSGTNAGSVGIGFYDGTPNQTRITVRNTTINGVDKAISQYAGISEALIYDNTFIGNNQWNQDLFAYDGGGAPGSGDGILDINQNIFWNDDGINLAGLGNCAFNNTLRGFGDSISFAQHVGGTGLTETRGTHAYRNDIRDSGDDLTEVDYAHRNITFYDNRSHNSMTFISLDPLYGGPFIAARNIVINTGRTPFKWNSTNSGQFIYNNTVVRTTGKYLTVDGIPTAEAGWYQPNNGAQRAYGYQNNVLVYRGAGSQTIRLDNSGHNPVDFTHNSWYPNSTFQWPEGTYNNLGGAYNGLPASSPVFSAATKRHEQDNATVSNPWTTVIALGANYLTKVTATYTPILAPGMTPKNSGVMIPNITDGFSGAAPDRGALIEGRAIPLYGDRADLVPAPAPGPTPAPGDTEAPVVSITTPSPSATLSGTVTVSASASDNTSVAGVQFRLDGISLGGEVTTAPYSITWNTANYANGLHTLTAIARDISGLQTTSSGVTVSVSNTSTGSGSSVLLVNFGATAAGNVFGLPGWSTAIKDVYTDYVNIGPGGTTIVIGDNYSYNFQGVIGTARTFVSGEKIVITWYNNSANSITFNPKISFTDSDRIAFGVVGVWYDMGTTTVSPFGNATSEYTFTASTAGSYSIVNVNSNFANTSTLIADKIELIPLGSAATDSTPPVVSITAPTTGGTVSGTSFVLSASASDNVGVVGVQFKVDNTNLGTEDTTAPYSIVWDTTLSPNGSRTITAVARDAAGLESAASVTVTVNNALDATSPTVSIITPASGSTVFGASVMVSASATDNVGVAGVQFQLDGVALGAEDTVAPFSILWNTTSIPNGSHLLKATARDGAGNKTTSAELSINVNNDSLPPLVAITAPVAASTVSGPSVMLSASATDNVGIVGVQFRIDGVNLGSEVLTPPYVFFWNATQAVTGTHAISAVARDAAGNQTTSTAVNVTVNNGIDLMVPLVSITEPQPDRSLSAFVTLLASASDDIGVVGVQFLVDGVILGVEDTAPPYSIVWDTTKTFNGSHKVMAIARDGAGKRSNPSEISVTVSNVGSGGKYRIPRRGGGSWKPDSTPTPLSEFDTVNSDPLKIAYLRIQTDAGNAAPTGAAIIAFSSNGVLVSEAGVPTVEPATSGLFHAEVAGSVTTGIALANPNNQESLISYTFYNTSGSDVWSGSFTLGPNQQMSAMLDQPPFAGPKAFLGTFAFMATTPVSTIALRGLTNERNEFLMTTLPIAPFKNGPIGTSMVMPFFADGGGWSTQVILENPGGVPLDGTVQFFGPGSPGVPGPLLNMTVNGAFGSTFNYYIPPFSSMRLVTAGTPASVQIGSVRISPAGIVPTPQGLAIFSFRTLGTTVSEASVPLSPSGTGFQTFVENSVSDQIRTGLAISNLSAFPTAANLELTTLDGEATGLFGSVQIPGNGQISQFLDEIFPSLPVGFQGVLRVTSTSAISVIGLRGRVNTRGDFLVTTIPVSNDALVVSTPFETVFPHIVTGGGYTTQFVLFSSGPEGSASGTLQLLNKDGTPLTPLLPD